ncbi:MAG TPA: hypothetical protein VHE83_03895 [Mycobacteriales bacterium]|nr:hypothetical protein [Mycobacteriales bacterium]
MTLTAPELPDNDAAAGAAVAPVVPDSRLVLVDPTLPAETARHLLSALGETAGVGVRCADRSKMLSAVRPGVVVVLADAHPGVVGMLNRWGASVVAVALADSSVVPWLVDVVEEGAVAALMNPDDDALAEAVIAAVESTATT